MKNLFLMFGLVIGMMLGFSSCSDEEFIFEEIEKEELLPIKIEGNLPLGTATIAEDRIENK